MLINSNLKKHRMGPVKNFGTVNNLQNRLDRQNFLLKWQRITSLLSFVQQFRN